MSDPLLTLSNLNGTDLQLFAIAVEQAKLTRIVGDPLTLEYGSDLDLTSGDMTPDAAELAADSQMAIVQDVVHRLSETRGRVPDAPDIGEDVLGLLNKGMSSSDFVERAGRISNEVSADDRIDSATTTITLTPDGSTFNVSIRIVPIDPAIGPFRLILAVTGGAMLLQAIQAAP